MFMGRSFTGYTFYTDEWRYEMSIKHSESFDANSE